MRICTSAGSDTDTGVGADAGAGVDVAVDILSMNRAVVSTV